MKSRSSQQKRICMIEFIMTLSLCLILLVEIRHIPDSAIYDILLLLTAPVSIAVFCTFVYHLFTRPESFRVKENDTAGALYYTLEVKTFLRGWHTLQTKKVYFNKDQADEHIEYLNSYYNEKVTLFQQFCQW